MSVQRVQKEDLAQLALLLQELSGEECEQTALARNYEQIRADDRVILLCDKEEETGDLLGTVMGIVCVDLVSDGRPFMVIENVVVGEQARGKGVGRRLMEALEQEARERRCTYIILVSSGKRKGAHAFYTALGYAENPARGFKKHLDT